jgi:hypothetical protein
MQFIKDNKMYILVIALAVVGLWAYMTYFTGDGSDASLTTNQTSSPLSSDVLVTLSNLHTIKLDTTIFDDPLFRSLGDFSVAIPEQPVGRRNPFAPL